MGWGALTHVINITDVGHLTSDADAGDDKMEAAARARGQDIWAVAEHYTAAFKGDLRALNIRAPSGGFPRATDHVAEMIAFGERIADAHCYRLASGLYFDVTTVPGYGALARSRDDVGESRIDPVRRQAQHGRLRDLAHFGCGREPADGVGLALGPRRTGLAPGMLGDEPQVSGRADSTSTPAALTTARSTIPTRLPRTRPSAAARRPARTGGCTTTSWSSARARCRSRRANSPRFRRWSTAVSTPSPIA